MANGLYGQGASSGGSLYGRPEPLSKTNAHQAAQLGLPEAQQTGAGSQVEADDPFANFETIFNLNQGNAAEETKAATDKVRQAAGESIVPTSQDLVHTGGQQVLTTDKGPATPPEPASVPAPVAAIQQAPDLVSKQNLADQSLHQDNPEHPLLGQYGQESTPPPASQLQIIGGNGGTTKLGGGTAGRDTHFDGGGAPVTQQYADTGKGERTAHIQPGELPAITPPAPAGEAPAQTAPLAPGAVAAGGEEALPTSPLGPAPVASEADSETPNFASPDRNVTDEEKAQYDKLKKTNDLLKGYATDDGQGILQDIYGEATPWDAAIMNAGGGKAAFGALQKQYGGQDDAYAKKVASDVMERRRQADATDAANAFNHRPKDQAAPDQATDQSNPAQDLDTILYNGGESWMSELHTAGLNLSPADMADIEAADASNTDLPVVTEEFSKTVTGGLSAEAQKAWWPAKFNMAYQRVMAEYGQAAMDAYRKALANTPGMMEAYKSMKNPGYMRHQMRAWLESAGFQKHAPHSNDAPEVKLTNDNDAEALRRRLASGYEVTDTDGKTYTSLAAWDAAHRP